MMGKWVECIGEYDSEAVATWAALQGTVSGFKSPWTPLANGRIKKLRIVFAGGAATQLIDHVQFRLKSAAWPVESIVGADGGGVHTNGIPYTAPSEEWEVDLPITAGVPITIEGRNVTVQTPVTVMVLLYATIEG
jgi:hypothetical protein